MNVPTLARPKLDRSALARQAVGLLFRSPEGELHKVTSITDDLGSITLDHHIDLSFRQLAENYDRAGREPVVVVRFVERSYHDSRVTTEGWRAA